MTRPSPRRRRPEIDRLVVDHIDPENLVAGGVDTCIRDIVAFGAEAVGIAGVTTTRARELGVWHEIELGGRRVPFCPVARLDRTVRSGPRRFVPHSVIMIVGLVRFRRRMPRALVQSHRIETGLVASLLGIGPVVQFVHNDSRGLTGVNSDSSWKHLGFVYRRLEALVLRRARAVVVFNRPDGNRIRRLRSDALVVQTWFDPHTFRMKPVPAQSGQHGPVVLWVGRLEAQKDPLLAVQVLAALRATVPDARLRVVGDGRLRGEVERHADATGQRGAVHFAGSVTRAEVAAELRSADVLLMTSHYEGSPRVLAESCASGTPVVATVESDPDEAITDGGNGYRVAGRDPVDLARSVRSALQLSSRGCAESVRHRAGPVVIEQLLAVGRGGA